MIGNITRRKIIMIVVVCLGVNLLAALAFADKNSQRNVTMTENGTLLVFESNQFVGILPVSNPDNRDFMFHGNYIYCLLLKDNSRWLVMVYDHTRNYRFVASYYWSGRGPWCCRAVE
ncbi:MAG: hypothetical protein AB7S77_16425 [Desulfatirhabdiaceae bacterium]